MFDLTLAHTPHTYVGWVRQNSQQVSLPHQTQGASRSLHCLVTSSLYAPKHGGSRPFHQRGVGARGSHWYRRLKFYFFGLPQQAASILTPQQKQVLWNLRCVSQRPRRNSNQLFSVLTSPQTSPSVKLVPARREEDNTCALIREFPKLIELV